MKAVCNLSKSFLCSSVAFVVFTEKVLKRLFPNVSSGGDKGTPQTPALETPPKNVTPEAVQHTHDHRPTGKGGLQVSVFLELNIRCISYP